MVYLTFPRCLVNKNVVFLFFIIFFFAVEFQGKAFAEPLTMVSFELKDFSVDSDGHALTFLDEWPTTIETFAEGAMPMNVSKSGVNFSAVSESADFEAIGRVAIGGDEPDDNNSTKNTYSTYSMVNSKENLPVGGGRASSRIIGINAISAPKTQDVDTVFSFAYSAEIRNNVQGVDMLSEVSLKADFWYFDPLENSQVYLLKLDEVLRNDGIGGGFSSSEDIARQVVLEANFNYPIYLNVSSQVLLESLPSNNGSPVPEPSSGLLFLFGLGSFLFVKKGIHIS